MCEAYVQKVLSLLKQTTPQFSYPYDDRYTHTLTEYWRKKGVFLKENLEILVASRIVLQSPAYIMCPNCCIKEYSDSIMSAPVWMDFSYKGHHHH